MTVGEKVKHKMFGVGKVIWIDPISESFVVIENRRGWAIEVAAEDCVPYVFPWMTMVTCIVVLLMGMTFPWVI